MGAQVFVQEVLALIRVGSMTCHILEDGKCLCGTTGWMLGLLICVAALAFYIVGLFFHWEYDDDTGDGTWYFWMNMAWFLLGGFLVVCGCTWDCVEFTFRKPVDAREVSAEEAEAPHPYVMIDP